MSNPLNLWYRKPVYKTYLEYSCTATIGNTPVPYFTISITRAYKVIFIWVEV